MLNGGAYTSTIKWKELLHHGPLFTEPYNYLGIPVTINQKQVILDPLAEEYAYYYARTPSHQKTDLFNKNFFAFLTNNAI